jgi:hypothetical protein
MKNYPESFSHYPWYMAFEYIINMMRIACHHRMQIDDTPLVRTIGTDQAFLANCIACEATFIIMYRAYSGGAASIWVMQTMDYETLQTKTDVNLMSINGITDIRNAFGTDVVNSLPNPLDGHWVVPVMVLYQDGLVITRREQDYTDQINWCSRFKSFW